MNRMNKKHKENKKKEQSGGVEPTASQLRRASKEAERLEKQWEQDLAEVRRSLYEDDED